MGRFYQAFGAITGHDDTFTLGHHTFGFGYVRCHLHPQKGASLKQSSISHNVNSVTENSMSLLLEQLEALASNLPALTNKHGQHPFMGFQRPDQVSIEDVTQHLTPEVLPPTIRPDQRLLSPGAE
jgi:hypothetical protein